MIQSLFEFLGLLEERVATKALVSLYRSHYGIVFAFSLLEKGNVIRIHVHVTVQEEEELAGGIGLLEHVIGCFEKRLEDELKGLTP